MFDEIKIYWDDSVGDMNLMTDSILGESDWLNDQSLGLENSIWECLSDKGKLGLNQGRYSFLVRTGYRYFKLQQ